MTDEFRQFINWDRISKESEEIVKEWQSMKRIEEGSLWHETNLLCGNVHLYLQKGQNHEDVRNDVSWLYRLHLANVKAKRWFEALKYDYSKQERNNEHNN